MLVIVPLPGGRRSAIASTNASSARAPYSSGTPAGVIRSARR